MEVLVLAVVVKPIITITVPEVYAVTQLVVKPSVNRITRHATLLKMVLIVLGAIGEVGEVVVQAAVLVLKQELDFVLLIGGMRALKAWIASPATPARQVIGQDGHLVVVPLRVALVR